MAATRLPPRAYGRIFFGLVFFCAKKGKMDTWRYEAMNLKDLKNKITAKINKSSLKTFFRKQGIYVLIFLCVAAAGVTAILTWPREAPVPDEGNTGVSVNEGQRFEDRLAARTPSPSPQPSPTPTVSPQDSPKPGAGTSKGGSIKLKKPVEGLVLTPFSGNNPVFFASLNMWRTHNGVDIKADKGAGVVAALSGTVSEVFTNEADGSVVILSHSDKTQTLYAGLGEVLVKADDKVNAGQQIGKIGEMPSELDLSYHLHFEYYTIADGKKAYKDPAKYFE